jgi:hypothetical protein
MFAHEKNRLDLFEAMNRGSLILINTAKDLLKQEGCEILGRFFVALVSQVAQERAVIPEDRRRSTFVYIDEAQDYFDESIQSLFDQARKYKVGLVIAHQNLDQFDQKLRAAVLSSTSVKLVGGLSQGCGDLCQGDELRAGILAKHAEGERVYPVCLSRSQSYPATDCPDCPARADGEARKINQRAVRAGARRKPQALCDRPCDSCQRGRG